ncbi:unnamed protein product [Lymnaea stagnalis]|uniref:AB hydrolase-1 domain-containing protein n=1 Tax=Lymnaea stagnalis TaxID=6523 RepID=A0AAV2IDT7_LYMST
MTSLQSITGRTVLMRATSYSSGLQITKVTKVCHQRLSPASRLVHTVGKSVDAPSLLMADSVSPEKYVQYSSMADNQNWGRIVTLRVPSKHDENKTLDFKVSVLDTYPDADDRTRPTVVAVHGLPGGGIDFLSLASKLHAKGIRFVAPTSLGMVESPVELKYLDDVDFSTKGRTKVLRQLLQEMNIHNVDLFMGHSAGAWTLYEVGAYWSNFGALLFVNPGGASPNRGIRPYFLMQFMAFLLQWSLGRWLILPVMEIGYKFQGFKEIFAGNGDHLVATQQYISNVHFENVAKNAAAIQAKAVPIVVMYSLNDKLIEPKISATLVNHLGIPEANTVRFSADKLPDKDPFLVPEGWLCRCLIFERGGHVAHLAHEEQLIDQIDDLLNYAAAKKQNVL